MKIHLFISTLIVILYQSICAETYHPAFSFPQTSIFTKSYSKNALYAVGASNYRIYRANFTRNISTVTPTSYSTTHTKKVRAIAVSIRETYVATGSQDLTIQVASYSNQTRLCKFTVFNQVRALVFHPLYQQILYSGSVDDVIRKWNITNCSKIIQKTITGSIHSIDINLDGSTLAFGTLQGHTGIIDSNLNNAATQTLNIHWSTVLYTYYTFQDFYITIGDDSVAILWNQGTMIKNYTALTYTPIFNCLLYDMSLNPSMYKFMTCYTDQANYVSTYKITNSTIQIFTTHGFNSYSNMNWIDYHSLNTDQHIYIIHYQSNIVYDRLYDENSTRCSDHYGSDLNTKICKMCGFMIPGCHFCDDSSKCTTCGIGTYTSSNLCYKCSQGCATCSSASNCNRCGVGYASNGASGTCKVMGKTGCFYYSNNGNTCNDAMNGYYVNSGGVVKPCSNADSACLQCTQSSSPSCLTCKTGYYVNGGTCASCVTPMPGCLACMNNNTCMNCAVAYKMNGIYLQCSNCYGTCQTCSYWYNDCITCYPSQYRNLSTTNCNCLPGYYDQISSNNNYTCGLCSSVLTFCYQCTVATICTQCQTNYYLYTAAGKTQCQLCNAYCQTCQGTSSNCTSCNPSYNRILSSNTCICSIGYVSIANSIPCQPCNRLNDGCILCNNASYCTTCDIGYYLVKTNTSYQLCSPCPYYCPSCSVNGVGNMICNSCPPLTHRSLVNGSCPCDIGYFDDNHTLTCQKCSDILSNCLTCTNRTKCLSCAPGLYTDQANTLCTTCMVTCATCGTYFDTCTTCDPATNRVLAANQKCICIAGTYQANGVCILCNDVIPNCNSCTNPYSCTGCISGYTLQQDLKGCINCQGQINGCQTCTSATNCTTCKSPFILINNKCRCPLDQYTSDQIWGTCSSYKINGLKSSLNVQLQVHQHQNNTLIVFIRFRAKTLYVINKTIQNSIKMAINGIYVPINFDYIFNNHIKISTQINQTLYNPIINITFDTSAFYNQNLLPLANINQTVSIRRVYYYNENQMKIYTSFFNVCKYIFYIFKWVFFGITLIGQGHLLFPFVIFIQLMPLFLTLNMALPATVSMLLDSMFSFQIKSIVPLMSISSNFVVTFPNMVYDYYGLNDFFLFGKIGDLLLIILVNVFTKFDEGFVRMFPPGRIRRYVYQSLVRKGYAVMSLCILAFQPSFMLLAGVYINFSQWQSNEEIFNYCSCVFTFGFYLAYNFNHASNLQGSKAMKNIQNQQCFLDLNSQQPTAARTTLFVLACDIWLIGSLHLISPMIYFVSCIIFLTIRIILHIKRDYYIGRVQFAIRILCNIFILAIYCLMMIFHLAQSDIYLTTDKCQLIGIVATVLMLCYLFFQIIEKVLYNLKLQTDFLKVKTVQGQNGEQIVVQNGNQDNNGENGQKKQVQDDKISTKSQKMKQFITTSKDGGFSALNFRNKQNNKKQQENNNNNNDKQSSNYPMNASNLLNTNNNGNYNNNSNNLNNRHTYYRSDVKKTSNISINNGSMINGTDDFFKNSPKQMTKTQKQIRIKGANTSKYARNHLQLRYKAQGILTTHKNIPDQDKNQ